MNENDDLINIEMLDSELCQALYILVCKDKRSISGWRYKLKQCAESQGCKFNDETCQCESEKNPLKSKWAEFEFKEKQ